MIDDAIDPTRGALSPPHRSRSSRRPARKRDFLPGLVTAACLLASYFLYGATQPIAALVVSACLIVAALAAVALAGPQRVTLGMLVVALLLWGFTLTGWAGRLDRAAPDLAVLFGAGAIWTLGYVCARQRGALEIAWMAVIWASLTYCIWMFFAHLASGLVTLSAQADSPLASRAAASLLFGLFALLGASRVGHVIKQMDAEALSRSEMIDRLLRDGLGGLLLLGFALTCLVLTGSLVGLLITGGVLLAHVWWDTRGIVNREHRSAWVRWLGRLSPFVAILMAVAGVALAYVHDESIAPGAVAAVVGDAPRLARLSAYMHAWQENPFFGQGLGSIDIVAARETTLANTIAMTAPGGAQNLGVQWLVEVGVVGAAVMLLVMIVMHVGILAGFSGHKAPRTFLRLAIVAGGLMLLHGIADSALDLPSAVWLYAFMLGTAGGVASRRKPKAPAQPTQPI